MRQGQRIAKNAVAGLGSGAIAGAIDLAVVAILARYLGVAGFGTYAFVLAFVRIFQQLGDLGIRSILLRDIAADHGNAGRVLGVARALVWMLSLGAFAIIVAIIHLIQSDPEVIKLTYLAGLALITILNANAYGAVCRAFEEMEFNAIGHVLERVLFLALAVMVVWLDWGLRGVFVGLLLANLVLWAFYYVVVRIRYVRPRLSFEMKAWWAMAREAVPVGLGVILRRVSWQVDTVLLVQFADLAGAGLFNAAYRITAFMQQFATTLSHPFAPVYARLATGSRGPIEQAYEKSLKLFWAMGVPVAAVIGIFAEPIVRLLYGEQFASAAPSLQMQGLAILFLFPTTLYMGLFTALGRQRLYMILVGACLLVNTVFDLLLIPQYSHMGASIATVLAEVTLFALGTYFLGLVGLRLPMFGLLGRPLAAGLVTGLLIMYPLRAAPLHWQVLGAIVGAVVYGGLLRLFRVFSGEEVGAIRRSLSFWRRPPGLPVTPGRS
jgi:O-antigen/teichoic acid export membrane protein